MTSSSKPSPRAAVILRDIQEALDEDKIGAAIDDPIDEVLTALDNATRPSSARELIDRVAAVVQELFARLPIARRHFDEAQARDEAVWLITLCYREQSGAGFEAALIEALDDDAPGLELLYRRLGEHLKARLRQAYVARSFSRHLDPGDWDANRNVAAFLLEKLASDLPEDAPALRPEQFVDCIPELFFAVNRAEHPAASLLADRFLTDP